MRTRLTIRELMTLVVLVGVVQAVFKEDFSLGCLASGVVSLALLRTRGKIKQARVVCEPLRPIQEALT